MTTINEDLRDQAHALFEEPAPGDGAYEDTTPVTVTLTKAQAYHLRGALRLGMQDVFSKLSFIEMFGDENVEAANSMFALATGADAVLAEVAPVGDYPREEVELAEPALV